MRGRCYQPGRAVEEHRPSVSRAEPKIWPFAVVFTLPNFACTLTDICVGDWPIGW